MSTPTALRFAEAATEAAPIHFATLQSWPDLSASLPQAAQAAKANGFEAKPGQCLIYPLAEGVGAVFIEPDEASRDAFSAGKLATLLPPGVYRFANAPAQPALAALAFLLSSYKFSRYKKTAPPPSLVAPAGCDAARVETIANSIALARDLVNTPANDMGPEELAQAALQLANRHGATTRAVVGSAALQREFPLIFAVGKGSPRAPRLIEFCWGQESAPKVTLVGKGVCFDSGGLDIKPESAMALMKKDMGGAAAALALASMIMEARLPVRLRVILPIVENAVSGDAFRPGDVYVARNGLSVEIGNTDAEGRLILADALALADDDEPDLLIDFATLTGAARVALGPDLPPFFTRDDDLAREIGEHGARVCDPVWRLPLWKPYASMLEGKTADLTNAPAGGFAGAITAALFLERFVAPRRRWVHFDIYGWNPSAKPGRPEGGEAQAARLLFDLIGEKCANGSLR